MNGRYLKKLASLGLGIGMALGFAQGATAATTYNMTWSMDNSVGYNTASGVYYNGTNVVPTGYVAEVGRILLTDSNSGLKLESFCVDIADDLVNGPFVGDYATTSTLNISSAKLGQLTTILSNADNFIAGGTDSLGGSSADRSAGVQMAVWEIMYDATYDATSGNVYESGVSGKGLAEASAVISSLSGANPWTTSSGFKVALVRATGNQTQIVYGPEALGILSAIPEPASWGMMVLGFGVIGSALRRKKVSFAAIA